MEGSQAKQILLKVTLVWQRQQADEAVQCEWCESLLPVSFQAALEAVREFRDDGRHDAPTVGEIRRMALEIDKRAEDERRRRTWLLEAPRPSSEERKRVATMIGECLEKISVGV